MPTGYHDVHTHTHLWIGFCRAICSMWVTFIHSTYVSFSANFKLTAIFLYLYFTLHVSIYWITTKLQTHCFFHWIAHYLLRLKFVYRTAKNTLLSETKFFCIVFIFLTIMRVIPSFIFIISERTAIPANASSQSVQKMLAF